MDRWEDPIKTNKAFFFFAYEGYRQRGVVAMNASVPTQRFRDILTTSLPFKETQTWMKYYPLPNQPLTASDALLGVWIGPGAKSANDDHVDAKIDYLVGGGNLSMTLAASHPDLSVPVDLPTNPRIFTSKWRRMSVNYVLRARPVDFLIPRRIQHRASVASPGLVESERSQSGAANSRDAQHQVHLVSRPDRRARRKPCAQPASHLYGGTARRVYERHACIQIRRRSICPREEIRTRTQETWLIRL